MRATENLFRGYHIEQLPSLSKPEDLFFTLSSGQKNSGYFVGIRMFIKFCKNRVNTVQIAVFSHAGNNNGSGINQLRRKNRNRSLETRLSGGYALFAH